MGEQFRAHQFERASPVAALDPILLERIYSTEVVLPPARYLNAPGTQPTEGLIFLASLARFLGVQKAFEVGTFTGLTTLCLARNADGAVIHTLDLPPGKTPQLQLEESDLHRPSEKEPMLYELHPHGAEVVQHWGDSATFDFSQWDHDLDLVYIDGAHSEEYVYSDSRNALNMISPHGAIVWDDYWHVSPGVTRVVEDLAGDFPLRRVPGTRLVVYMTDLEQREREARQTSPE